MRSWDSPRFFPVSLMPPVTTDDEWVDYGQYLQQLEAACQLLICLSSPMRMPTTPKTLARPSENLSKFRAVQKPIPGNLQHTAVRAS
jgi:hypothetical protein